VKRGASFYFIPRDREGERKQREREREREREEGGGEEEREPRELFCQEIEVKSGYEGFNLSPERLTLRNPPALANDRSGWKKTSALPAN